MVHVYTGNGKGKTTAALGVALRMLGHKKRVCIIQFMKNNPEYGEIRFFDEIEGIDIFQFGTKKHVKPEQPSAEDAVEAQSAFSLANEVLEANRYHLVIVDEINIAVAWGLIDLADQKRLMEITTKSELIMTGRSAHPDIIEMADLVTEMKEIKHYYQKNVKARKGIEF